MNKIIILDRDGVINQDSDQFIKSVDEFIPIPGSLEAIAQLYQAGFKVVVATNQSGIARGLLTLETLKLIHSKLQGLLSPLNAQIEHFYFCPHGPQDNCSCRKPKPGMMHQIIEDYFSNVNINDTNYLAKTYVIGDSLRDLDAGIAAGAQVALVKTGKGLRSLQQIKDDKLSQYDQIPVFKNLLDFTQHYLKDTSSVD